MDAYEVLKEQGLTELLGPVRYVQPQFVNWGKVQSYLLDVVSGKRSVSVIGDYDVDGLMCALIFQEGLRGLGVTDISAFRYLHRTHSLDPTAVRECIQRKSEYCIICDCGSRDISLLRMLLSYGIKVILLDHHRTMTSYAEFEELGDIAVINTMLENKKYCLSAGALCYCVMRGIYTALGISEEGLAAYGLISLFADCMNMKDELNRAIYFLAISIPKERLPKNITMFMNEYQRLNNRFITFWFSPRINAMFRSENLEVINRLFLSDVENAVVKSQCLEEINTKYKENRELIQRVADLIDVEEVGGFVIGNLQTVNRQYSVEENMLWNYTGLVANILSSNYSRPAFVYCINNGSFKGSVRDIFGRDYLSMFKQLCKADGHNPAFGVRIAALDFEEFMQSFHRVVKKMDILPTKNKPVILDYKYMSLDSALIEDVAMINEFSGQDVPVVLLRKQLIGSIRETKTKYNFRYSWEEYWIQSQFALSFGSMMLLKPTKSWHTKLLIQ